MACGQAFSRAPRNGQIAAGSHSDRTLRRGNHSGQKELLRFDFDLAKVSDTANVQFICPSQFNQLVAACDVAAVHPSVRNMPCIVLAAMQPNGESLRLKLCQSGIQFQNS